MYNIAILYRNFIMHCHKNVIFIIFIILNFNAKASDFLSLEDYLHRVERINPQIQGTTISIEAMSEKALELDMVYSPYLNSRYTYSKDKSGASFGSSLPLREVGIHQWEASLNKKTSLGMEVSTGYSSLSGDYKLSEPEEISKDNTTDHFKGYEVRPFLRVEQSLLRDYRSGLTQSGIDKSKALVKAGQHRIFFQKQQILLSAQSAYWALSLAREVVCFRKASLARTLKLLEWTRKQLSLDLVDQSDLLQTEAAYETRALALEEAEDNEKKASRDFNRFLGKVEGSVENGIGKIADQLTGLDAPGELIAHGTRADLLAMKAEHESYIFAERETKFRSMPEVSFVGEYSLNGRDMNSSDTYDQIYHADKPVYTVGLTCTVPLDYKTLKKVREGFSKDLLASGEYLKSAENAVENDWEQLMKDWKTVHSRIKLAEKIRRIQESRVENEEKRFERGRTTTFQRIDAENDLDDATLNLYQLIYQKLLIEAEAGLYNTASEF